jgi:Transglycosylase SLT domain
MLIPSGDWSSHDRLFRPRYFIFLFRRTMRHLALPTLLALSAFPDIALCCWHEAGQRYSVSPQLLHAIAEVESSLNPQAINRRHQQRTGSYDIGLMQINSTHLPALKRLGIQEADLYDPCVNIHVGAWLLSQQFVRLGHTWDAVGAYNAACTTLKELDCQRARSDYAWRVYRRLSRQPTSMNGTTIATAIRPVHAQRERAAAATILAVKVSP